MNTRFSFIPSRLVSPAILGALLISLSLSGCGQPHQAGGQNPGMPVTMLTLDMGEYTDISEFLAQIDSKHATSIHPQVASRITRVFVEDGQSVSAGQPLFQLDASQQSAQVKSLQASHSASTYQPEVLKKDIASQQAELSGVQAQLDFNRQQLERYKQLQQNRTVSARDTEQYATTVTELENRYKTLQSNIGAKEAELRQSYANVSRDKATYDSARANLSYYTVTAPFAGKVGILSGKVGDMVDPSTSLTTLTDDHNLEVIVAIPADYRSRLKIGTPIALVSNIGESVGKAHIDYIDPKVDSMSQTLMVKAKVVNGQDMLAMDQRLKARLIWGESKALKVPVEAIFRQAGQPFVYLAEKSKSGLVAKMKAIELGPIDGQFIVVRSGLKAGQTLITGGIQKLQDSAPVVKMAKE